MKASICVINLFCDDSTCENDFYYNMSICFVEDCDSLSEISMNYTSLLLLQKSNII